MQNQIKEFQDVFQKRRNHLFRALAEPPQRPEDTCSSIRLNLLQLYEAVNNKQNLVSQLDYFIKHQFNCHLVEYTEPLMELLWQILKVRSGGVVAFIIYRLCRKYPDLFWKVKSWVDNKIDEIEWKKDEVIIYTDLFLYGFPFTQETFNTKIFIRMKKYLVEMIPRYYAQLSSSIHFPLKSQKMFNSLLLEWMEEEKQSLMILFQELKGRSIKLQHSIVNQLQVECEMDDYQGKLEKYQTFVHRFGIASNCLEIPFDQPSYRLKTVYQLKKECQTFRLNIELSPFQRQIYLGSGKLLDLKPFKKHQMLKLDLNDAYIIKIKLCSTLQDCIDLAGYFLQQMNLQNNKEHLIQTIINNCYNHTNLPYILKVVFQIGEIEQSIKDYCNAKAKKICGPNKMNQKYQKLLCQMARFKLIDEKILLDYCDRIIKNQNNQITKEIQFILEHLGTLIYYRSLTTHIRINNLFEKMESIMKSKVAQFNMEHLYQLKGIINYLRNYTKSANIAETHEMVKIGIKDNFEFILNKMQKKLKENDKKYIIEYMVCGIDSEEYLASYFYASLLRELNNSQLEKQVHELVIKTIIKQLRANNGQKAVRWSRLLGELYNYQCINRKMYLEDISELLKKSEDGLTSGGLKCVCAALQTSKYYLQLTTPKRQRQIMIMLLELKLFYLKVRDSLEVSLNCQTMDILQFFNPQLLLVLDTPEGIQQFLQTRIRGDQNKNNAVSHFIGLLVEGSTLDQTKPPQREVTSESRIKASDSRIKYRQKEVEKSQKQLAQKKPSYKQKVESIPKVSQFRVQKERQRQMDIQESVKTHESSLGVVKKMKFMGRSRKDNKIKTINCTLVDIPNDT